MTEIPRLKRAVEIGIVVAAVTNVAANLVTALTLVGEMRHWWDVL